MSPIDDELRTALSSRTDHVELPPDFFTGVERRARGLRRRKMAATVAGSALAVSALGIGTPIAASLFDGPTRTPGVDQATQAPATSHAFDPAAPWAYRGDAQVREDLEAATRRQWLSANPQAGDDAVLVPLFGQVYEPSQQAELVYLVRDGDQAYVGVGRSWDGDVELVADGPLAAGTAFLAFALPGDEVPRLLVLTSPAGLGAEYASDGATEWQQLADIGGTAGGVFTGPLDGVPAEDLVRVLDRDGEELFLAEAPDPASSTVPAPQGEGPGTDTPLDVDVAPYALDLDEPWAYRGPSELTQHPGLAAEDQRRFEQGGRGRGGDAWSQTPLLGVELDGLSVLLTLHRSGDEAYVTTTWQKQDEAPRHAEQPVRDGTLVVQSFLPQSDGTGVLVALAAPRTGAVETDVQVLEQVHNEQGYGVWQAPAAVPAGELFLYSEGDGLLYHSEPLRRS